jgi:uncharacterized cofD-like protein
MVSPNVVVLGGGTGTSTLLRGLRDQDVQVTAVVAMFDDGGSTGLLRQQLSVPALGDLRQCLAALSTVPQVAELFEYRFTAGEVAGHNLGNLILAALHDLRGGLAPGIAHAADLLAASGRVVPVTLDESHLLLRTRTGREIRGEINIWGQPVPSEDFELTLEPAPTLNPAAASAIAEADLVVVAPGSFYTSIIPLLLVPEICEALDHADAPLSIVVNLVNKPGHTDGFAPEDYVRTVERVVHRRLVDYVIHNVEPISPADLDQHGQGADQVVERPPMDITTYEVIRGRFVAAVQPRRSADGSVRRTMIKHDPHRIANVIVDLCHRVRLASG